MIIHNVEQNSEEWYALRRGMPTSSNFFRIITPGGKKSGAMDDYAFELLGEMFTGENEMIEQTEWMKRGTELEESAAQLYAFKNRVELSDGGFVTDDARTMGCSPDRLINGAGGLEIKAYKNKNHMKQLWFPTIDEKHKPQIQGSLAILGWEWWDVMSYNPKTPPEIVRAYRDETYIKDFLEYHRQFMDILNERKEKLIKKGCEIYA